MALTKYIKRGLEYIFHGVPQTYIEANVVSLAPSELLSGRCALITGGTSGIGFAIAEAFVKAGAKVIITGRSEEKIVTAINNLNKKGDERCAYGTQMDVKNIGQMKDIVGKLVRNDVFACPIDILVNNAGIMGHFGVSDESENDFDEVIDTNLKGPFFLSSFMGQYMKDNHIEGNILNIASSSSLRPANSAYGISKWGLRGFTQGLAKSLISYRITVNGLAPGPTATPMVLNGINKGFQRDGIFGRYIMPEEIANMAVFLVSGIGKAIVGDIVYMTGGYGLLTTDDIPCKF